MILYHLFRKTDERPLHWSDHPDWRKLDLRSARRVRHLLGSDRSFNPEDRRDLELYGLGTVRSLEEYQAFSGIDFRMMTIGDRARAGRVDGSV